jgi:hypothetical protein
MRKQRAKLSRHNDIAKAMDYKLKRWSAFTRFLDDCGICLSNNAAERARAASPWVESRRPRRDDVQMIVTCLCRARHKAVYAEEEPVTCAALAADRAVGVWSHSA